MGLVVQESHLLGSDVAHRDPNHMVALPAAAGDNNNGLDDRAEESNGSDTGQ